MVMTDHFGDFFACVARKEVTRLFSDSDITQYACKVVPDDGTRNPQLPQALDDRRRCCQQARPSTSFVDNTLDLPWRNF